MVFQYFLKLGVDSRGCGRAVQIKVAKFQFRQLENAQQAVCLNVAWASKPFVSILTRVMDWEEGRGL